MKNFRFIVDGMHGTLARKLRIYGFDTIYESNADDKALLELSKKEDRALITSDKMLHSAAVRMGVNSILITGSNDEERMIGLFKRLKMKAPPFGSEASRCPVCNGELRQVERSSLVDRVPENVLKRKNEFYLCSSCGKVYWEGGHWRRLRRFARKVERGLQEA